MQASFLKTKHDAGHTYENYLKTGNSDQQANWQAVYDQTTLTGPQQELVESFTRQINVIAVSGIWCGDCVQQGPLIARIAQANPKAINLRWVDRDEHMDLSEQLTINAGLRVPVIVFCAEDFEQVSWYGDKTLSRYRSLGEQHIGGACPLPSAGVPQTQIQNALQDWLNEFERVHLILRLSGRLRQKHGD